MHALLIVIVYVFVQWPKLSLRYIAQKLARGTPWLPHPVTILGN